MSDETDLDKSGNLAMASLKSRCDAHGVASLRFEDGEMFMFSKKVVEDLFNKMNESGQENAIIFVQFGPELKAD